MNAAYVGYNRCELSVKFNLSLLLGRSTADLNTTLLSNHQGPEKKLFKDFDLPLILSHPAGRFGWKRLALWRV